jgi:hypothetical protein
MVADFGCWKRSLPVLGSMTAKAKMSAGVVLSGPMRVMV